MGILLSAHSLFLHTLKAVFQTDFFASADPAGFSLPGSVRLPLNSAGIRPIVKMMQIVKKKVSAQSIIFYLLDFVCK
ncbi:MAG: hypothetical protein ACM337_00335 [Syntrophaceae bacterium]